MNIRIEINDENLGPPPRPVRRPRAIAPNSGAMLGMLPVISPLAAVAVLTFTLYAYPALRSKVLETAIPVPIASPIAPGFELACIAVYCLVMVMTRAWWKANFHGWNDAREKLYWRRFMVGWIFSACLSNYLLCYSPTPEQLLTGVYYTFQKGWWMPIALFPLFLVPWGDINHD